MLSSAVGKEIRGQFETQKKVIIEESKQHERTTRPPVFYDMPRPEQFRSNETQHSLRDVIAVPEGFFGLDHPTTTWMINAIKDTSEWRLSKSLISTRTRGLFDCTKYFQVVDRPEHYNGIEARLDKPLFNKSAMLYLSAFGISLYLKASQAALQLSNCRSGKSHLINVVAPQYAAFVLDRQSDLLKFNFDMICVSMEYIEGFRYLCNCGWNPSTISIYTYRRRYFQYSIPFTDWIDLVRYNLGKKPSLNVAKIVQTMYENQHRVSPNFNFSINSMKEIGKVMMEAFELKEITRYNFNNPTKLGMYAGRKILKNKDVPVPDEYATVFSDKDGKPKNPIRAVVPNVMSNARRLLTYQYYNDGKHLFCLPQILRALHMFRNNDFFVVQQSVKSSYEFDSCGAHRVFLDPLIFQINYFLHLKSDGMYLRHKQWSSHATTAESEGISEEERAWFYRFDTLNCLSLLAGLLQNCLIKNLSEGMIENLCDLIIQILVDAEMIEPFLKFSFYDTYFGLTAVINCVPNLMSKTIMRLLKKSPISLVNNYPLADIQRMFSIQFWKLTALAEQITIPKNIDELVEFLLTKRRKVSMKVEGAATGEAMSGASSIGAAGGITMFVRNYDDMVEISAADEAAEAPATETTKKQDEERKHVAEYKQMETDARYSSVFPVYFDGLNKMHVVLDENKMLNDCIYDTYMQRQLATFSKKMT